MSPWVLRLLLANAVVYLACIDRPELVDMGVFVPKLVLVRPWTLFTYMFLHADFWHLFFNMISLLIFGPRLETHLGSKRFITVYLVSGLTGAMLSLGFAPSHAILGASGATFGIMLGYARNWPSHLILIWGVFPVRARTLVIVFVVLSLLGGAGVGNSNVAHFAHLGGLVGAWLLLRRWEKKVERKAKAPKLSRKDMDRWLQIPLKNLHTINRDEVSRILGKLQEDGVESLTVRERAMLDRFSAS